MSNKILNSKEVLKRPDKTEVEGLVLMGDYSEQPTKNGGSYLAGSLQALGDVSFKVWSGSCYNDMDNFCYSGKVVHINAEVNEYGGAKSLIITGIYIIKEDELKEMGISEIDFLATRYDIDSYWDTLTKRIHKNVSEEAWQIYCLITREYIDRFKNEFGAMFYHDNCRGGLLAHTTKVVSMCSLLKMYSNISARVNNDVIYVGAAIHDIGKVIEYHNGVMSSTGKYVEHTIEGALIVGKYKESIIKLKGEEFYYTLLSVVSSHHGEYGVRPRTIAAYIVNQFDCLDSTLTLLDQNLANVTEANGQINFDGYKLV